MTPRLVIAIILAVLAIPVLLVGFVDPLEGGVALLVVAGVAGIVWALSRVPPPRLAWIAWLATMAEGVATVAYLVAVQPYVGAYAGNGLLALPPLLIAAALAWIAGVGVTLVGWVIYVGRLVRHLREHHAIGHPA